MRESFWREMRKRRERKDQKRIAHYDDSVHQSRKSSSAVMDRFLTSRIHSTQIKNTPRWLRIVSCKWGGYCAPLTCVIWQRGIDYPSSTSDCNHDTFVKRWYCFYPHRERGERKREEKTPCDICISLLIPFFFILDNQIGIAVSCC